MTRFPPLREQALARDVFRANYRITLACRLYREGNAQMSQALEGIRVIDFPHDQAGPSCTQMLAGLGADGIKIERPPHGDRARRLWNMDNPDLDSFFFLLLNSNKRSTVVNLRAEEGKEIARRLIKEADIVAENLGPGVMERLGLGYGAGKAAQPAGDLRLGQGVRLLRPL